MNIEDLEETPEVARTTVQQADHLIEEWYRRREKSQVNPGSSLIPPAVKVELSDGVVVDPELVPDDEPIVRRVICIYCRKDVSFAPCDCKERRRIIGLIAERGVISNGQSQMG